MAVVDNANVDLGVSINSSSQDSTPSNDQDQPNDNNQMYVKVSSNGKIGVGPHHHHHHHTHFDHHHHHHRSNGNDEEVNMRELQELFSKLNPMAEEFVPPSLVANNLHHGLNGGFYTNNNSVFINGNGIANGLVNGNAAGRRKKGYSQGKRRINSRTSMAQRDEIIRRTVYVSDIDQQVTEEQLAALFVNCGQVVDCRICGDPNSVLRFAFIEFTDEDGARTALNLAGTMLGFYPVRVLPSKTAIAPVNPTFLPRTEDEREMCARTIYCTNIDKKVTQADVKLFFETVCGEVYRLRLLGDYHHSTRIAFVEFVMAESAIAALNCSGVILGSLPIRVSPSKTPVRPRAPRLPIH
ncbi:RRM_1 domain-containing protein/PAM2 domain-containing protein/RRM_6 domain-containing protein [Cephalotus follicularis]|uniref:RRM_1 domain-containing protein/PAM2 domain-containing protein/RRM_6 domain-containing protein n=1 Tax=Cephalotus follicularis TaxID=3775 RepID=A0A1Q3C4U2_CEPFO|nr:RRM_1 domain-containing protein/PAM2 domain-containing protein/RRM_6 domain-containing protein [Cephalotus follicularis]